MKIHIKVNGNGTCTQLRHGLDMATLKFSQVDQPTKPAFLRLKMEVPDLQIQLTNDQSKLESDVRIFPLPKGITHVTHFEYQPCRHDNEGGIMRCIEPEDVPEFYSVYVRQSGEAQCIADCDREQDAKALTELLNSVLSVLNPGK